MFKSTLKNFFRNILYVFVPMGIFYLATIAAVILFFTQCTDIVIVLAKDISDLTGTAISADKEIFESYFDTALSNIDWGAGFFSALKQVFETNWIENTLQGFIDTLTTVSSDFSVQVSEMVSATASAITARLVAAVTAIAISAGAGFWACLAILRRGEKRPSLFKYILTYVAEILVVTVTLSLCSYLSILWKPNIIFSVILITVIYSVLALLVSYLLHGKGKVKFRKTVSLTNVLKMTLANFIPIILVGLIVLIIALIAGTLIAFLVAIPLAIYAIAIIVTGADAYVLHKVQKAEAAETARSEGSSDGDDSAPADA